MPLSKPADIHDRDAEWAELSALWQSPQPELAFVVGRRRAGKSYVLSRFAAATGGFYYQATRRTEREQLLNFSEAVGRYLGDRALTRGVPYPDWETAFEDLVDRADGTPAVIVLDEFPYLAAAAPALTSILQALWDHRWQKSRVTLVLSGSHMTAMRQLEAGDQPLYGRRTARLVFAPFAYHDVAHFVPDYGPVDQLRTYGIFGGLPGHLALLDPAAELSTNVARRMLHPSGRLFDEAQHLLDAFIADADVSYSIIEAIARGDRTWGRLASRVGRDGGALLRPMQWLTDMEIVRRVVPITDTQRRTSKRALYEIADPYVAFWHRFISPLVTAGILPARAPMRLWRELIAPKLDEYMGGVFESACRAFVRRGGHRDANGTAWHPLQVGRWWDSDANNEIDVVALDAGTRALVAECTWGAPDAHDLARLRVRADLLRRELPNGGTKVTFAYALFGRHAPADHALRRAVAEGAVAYYRLEALFAADW